MRKWLLGGILFVLFLVPNTVFADEKNWVCASGNLYDILSKGSKVELNRITEENIRNKSTLPQDYFNVKEQFGINSMEFQSKYGSIREDDYRFDVVSVNKKCNIHYNKDGSFSWTSCPTTAQYNTTNAPYTTYKFQKALSEFKFDGNGGFYVDIQDNFDSTLLIRVIRNGKANKEQYDFSSLQSLGYLGSNEIYELKSGGVRINFGAGVDVRLEFYINPNAGIDCAGAYVGGVDSVTPNYAAVDNPWKNSQVCKDYRNGFSYIPTHPTNYKQLLVPECYKDKIDYFSERPNISEESIQSRIEEVKKLFAETSDAEIKQLQCHYHTDGSREFAAQTKTFVYNPSGSTSSDSLVAGDYWAASCKETITIDYDQPKKVISGTGFPYDATLTVTRTCTPVAIRTVLKPTQCNYGIECWGGPANHQGEGGAGPNEEFDACVNTCDGGKYTKDCISKCYKSVYEDKETGYTKGVGNNFLNVVKAKQVASNICDTKRPNSPNYCYTSKGWTMIDKSKNPSGKTALGSYIYEVASTSNQQSNCNKTNSCTSFHGHTYTYLDGCNSSSNPTICYEVYRTSPRPNCSDNPEEDYRALKEAAEKEYEELLAAIKKYETTENFEMSVIDSYKRDNKGNLLETTNTSLDNMVKVTGGVYTYPDNKTYKETPGVSTQTYSTAGDKKSVPEIEVKKEYKIELPQAAIDQITGAEKYVKTDYKFPANERNGGNKYYTDINSGTYNDFRKWTNNYSPLDERSDTPFVGNNIGVVFKNIGTVQSGSIQTGASYTWDEINLDCFYGIINKRYIECDDGVCDMVCEEGDICTGGLQYMFRQVDLNNLFPERDPRWNWMYISEMDNYGYISQPDKVIEEVENKGDSTFSSENLDYNITITKENIRSIRRYNKSQGNYQNYEMDCTTVGNGMDICESNLLKDTNYVKTYIRNTDIGSSD